MSVGRYFIPNLERKQSPTDQVQFMTPGKKFSNKIIVVCLRGVCGVVYNGPVNTEDLLLNLFK